MGGQTRRSPVLVQRAVSEDPRWTRAVGGHLARPQGSEVGGAHDEKNWKGTHAGPVLPERARSECARSTRAIGDRPGYP